MTDTTAITLVSVSAGSVVAIGGGALNALFARRLAERQFAHEHELADVAELRSFLERALAAIEEVVECLLGISTDLGDAADVWPEVIKLQQTRRSRLTGRAHHRSDELSGRLQVRLNDQVQAIAELAEPVKQQLTGLMMRVGPGHPLAGSFRRLYMRLLDAVNAIPDVFPPGMADRDGFTGALDALGVAHGEFLELAASYVGVDLEKRKASRGVVSR